MPLNQVASQPKNLVPQIHPDVGQPVQLELPAYLGVAAGGKVALAALACQPCIHFGVGDLCGRDWYPSGHDGLNQRGSPFGDEALDERAGVEIIQRRSRRMVFEIGAPATLTRRTRLRGARVGRVTSPWAASRASRASRLAARSADWIGWISAIGLPRSVTTTSSPCLVRRRYWVNRFFSSRTPTVLMRSSIVAIVATSEGLSIQGGFCDPPHPSLSPSGGEGRGGGGG